MASQEYIFFDRSQGEGVPSPLAFSPSVALAGYPRT